MLLITDGSRNFTWAARTLKISKSSRPKTIDFAAVLQAIMVNPASSNQKVLGKLCI